jgi:hypothetical protein
MASETKPDTRRHTNHLYRRCVMYAVSGDMPHFLTAYEYQIEGERSVTEITVSTFFRDQGRREDAGNRICQADAIQSFPPRILATIMLATLSPMAFTMVAGASTIVPIIVMRGKASSGKP